MDSEESRDIHTLENTKANNRLRKERTMSIKRTVSIVAFSFVLVCAMPYAERLCASAYASEIGGKSESSLQKRIDTKNMTGVDLLIANLYNDDRLMYAVMVTLVMAGLGTTLAFLTDLVLKMLGVEVTRISHRE